MNDFDSPYLSYGFSNKARKIVVRDLIKRIKSFMDSTNTIIDTIAFRGMSGALIAPIVSDRLNIPMMMVRKGEKCHGLDVEGKVRNVHNYIIIDDFVCSGSTVIAIMDAISEKVTGVRNLVGIFCWQHCNKATFYSYLIDSMSEELEKKCNKLLRCK